MKIKIISLILMCILLISCPITTYASDISNEQQILVMPRFSNCSKCVVTFTVSDPNTAYVGVTYNAYSDTFVQAKVTVQIQKKFLGLFWTTVDIGYSNNEWVDYSSAVNGYFYNSFTIDGTGTYRANFVVEIEGKDGSVDVIEDSIERKYS
ncbi:MAG: hypothetical protein IJE43_12010 [Alphaproteobacteria bacterium]|nr:hypothetical protein [Alphaproteobacteria bacterium]